MVRGQKPVPALSARISGAVSVLAVLLLLLGQVERMRATPAAEVARLVTAAPATRAPKSPKGVESEAVPVPTRLALSTEAEPADTTRSRERTEPDAPLYAVRIPVAGIAAAELTDTFDARRSGGRTHRAIDILAPTGTPVLAAVDGHVVRTRESDLGGLTVYQVGPDSAWVYYYAHLDAYAEGLAAGQSVDQGDTLGFVGMTGNAPVPHLHFAVWEARPGSERLWSSRAVNPYLLLTR